ncbi:MAG: (2Fe-2S)-binding protein [Pirellulales bacterium]
MSPAYQCDSKIVCRCLKITEADILDAVENGELQSVQDVVEQTGAGDGCTACRRTILEYVLSRRNAVALGECG